MALKQQIQEDLKTALKERREAETGALRMLLSAITNKEKEGPQGEELPDEVVQEVVASEVKKRKEAKEAFEKGGRPELAKREQADAELFRRYLPEQMSSEEIGKLARLAVEETGASGPQDMGKVMKQLMPKVKGRAEGSEVSRIIQELLSQ